MKVWVESRNGFMRLLSSGFGSRVVVKLKFVNLVIVKV